MDPRQSLQNYLAQKCLQWARAQGGTLYVLQGPGVPSRAYLQSLRNQGQRQVLEDEFKRDMALGFGQVCAAVTALQGAGILPVITTALDLADPEGLPLAEFVADALLLSCGLPSRQLNRNWLPIVAVGLLLIVFFGLGGFGGGGATA